MADNFFGNNDNKNNNKQPQKKNNGSNLYWIYGLILVFLFIAVLTLESNGVKENISFNKFEKELIEQGLVKKVTIVNDKMVEVYLTEEALRMDAYKKLAKESYILASNTPQFQFKLVEGQAIELVKMLNQKNIIYESVERTNYMSSIISILIPIGILVLIWMFFMRRMGPGGPGGQIFNIGKSKASLFDKENTPKVTFNDVAGLEEAKEEVKEVVEFLKNPGKFRSGTVR